MSFCRICILLFLILHCLFRLAITFIVFAYPDFISNVTSVVITIMSLFSSLAPSFTFAAADFIHVASLLISLANFSRFIFSPAISALNMMLSLNCSICSLYWRIL